VVHTQELPEDGMLKLQLPTQKDIIPTRKAIFFSKYVLPKDYVNLYLLLLRPLRVCDFLWEAKRQDAQENRVNTERQEAVGNFT